MSLLQTLEQKPSVPVGVASFLLGRSRFTVYRLLASGDLESVSVCGSSFVSLVSIRRVLARRKLVGPLQPLQ